MAEEYSNLCTQDGPEVNLVRVTTPTIHALIISALFDDKCYGLCAYE